MHTVRHTIQQLRDSLKLQAYCFTNPFKLGLVPYRALFSVNSANQARYQKMINYLGGCPEVSWFYEVQGYYEFLMAIRVRGSQQLDEFMYEFDKQFGEIIVSRTLAEMVRTTYLCRGERIQAPAPENTLNIGMIASHSLWTKST